MNDATKAYHREKVEKLKQIIFEPEKMVDNVGLNETIKETVRLTMSLVLGGQGFPVWLMAYHDRKDI